MRRGLPYVVVGMLLLPACSKAPATKAASRPDVAAADTPPADTAVVAPAAPSGRGFRFSGNQIVADTFEVRHTLHDGELTLSLTTDLGDDTEVFVSVGRGYRERGGSGEYLIEYFNEAGTVGQWRSGQTIDLTATDFWGELTRLRRALALQGSPFDVGSVSDSLKIDFVVYPGQHAPFVRGNANLSGKAVSVRERNRVIEKDLRIRYPAPRGPAGERD